MARRTTLLLAAASALMAHTHAQTIAPDEWSPLITPGDERLFSLRWQLAASREYIRRHEELGALPLHRTIPQLVPPGGFIGNRPTPLQPFAFIDVRAAVFVAPLQWRTASSEAYPQFLEGSLSFNARRQTETWTGEDADLPDVINVEWRVQAADEQGNSLVPIIDQPERIDIDFRVPVRLHETRFDEKRAMSLDWPSAWPSWTQPLRDPQRFIASDANFVGNLLNTWTDNAPQSMKPARLAKFLAAKVIDSVQPGADPRAFWPEPDTFDGGYPYVVTRQTPFPFLRGVDVQDERIFVNQPLFVPRLREPVESAQSNAAVITNLYVALLRAADIPARVIIGVLPPEAELARIPGRDTKPNTDTIAPVFRFWAEFYLWDEEAQRGQWIPVDLIRQRDESSRSRPLDQTWRYFGNHDELDEIVPISSVYTPETAEQPHRRVPAFWGWRPTPRVSFGLDPVIRFEVSGASRRAGDPFGEIGVNRGN